MLDDDRLDIQMKRILKFDNRSLMMNQIAMKTEDERKKFLKTSRRRPPRFITHLARLTMPHESLNSSDSHPIRLAASVDLEKSGDGVISEATIGNATAPRGMK